MSPRDVFFAFALWFAALGIGFQVAASRGLVSQLTADTQGGLCVWMCLVICGLVFRLAKMGAA